MFSFLPPSLQNPFFISEICIPIILIFLDVVTGIASALHHGTFKGKLLSDFLGNDVMRYIIAIVSVSTMYGISGSAVATTVASTLGLGALGTATATSIYENCRELLSPAEMTLLDQAGALLGYPDTGQSGPFPPAANPVSAQPTPIPTAQGTFVDQRPISGPPTISLPPISNS